MKEARKQGAEKVNEEKIGKQRKKQFRLGALAIAVMILSGSLWAFYRTMDGIENRMNIVWLIAFALAGMVCCEIAGNLKGSETVNWAIRAVPWAAALAVTGFHGYFNGMKAWINGMIHRWNQIHEGGVALFGGSMTKQDILAFGIVLAVLMGQLLWVNVMEGRVVFCWIWGMVWVVLMGLGGSFSTFASSLIFCGLLGMYIAGKEMQMNRISLIWLCVLIAVCLAGMTFIPAGDLSSVEEWRAQTKKKVHELRYGEEKFPAGNLKLADAFQTDSQKMLKVASAQEKNLYLKAFVGGVYRDGVWENMPESEYGGKNAGMFTWLKDKNFDPLTQSADYYRIGGNTDIEQNKVKIEVSGASRDYFYATGTLKNTLDGKYTEKKDYGLFTRGLTGERQYTFSEVSESRPAELLVAESWVQNPKTKKQKTYAEAEAVYRAFVYEHYTTVDKQMYRTVNDIFWKDYHSESDGIYSALTQIRNKLKEEYIYTKSPETGESEDTIRWFLEDSHTGNAMLYASAAVEAFRAHGIPARYVEGYFVPQSAIAASEDGYVLLSGEDMHAWAEVYFDGIGWLPVDVTPGYYYDTAALQKMVSTPDQVQKNAALKDNTFGGKQTSGLEGAKRKIQKQVKKQVKNILALILGVAAVLIVCTTIWILIMEAGEMVLLRRLGRKYQNAGKREKVLILEREMFLILRCMNIEAHLGWKTQETDRVLQKRFEDVKPGEYQRTCELLEKQLYGEIVLERYEERTLEHFLKKLLQERSLCDWKTRWKIHQRHFGFAIMTR